MIWSNHSNFRSQRASHWLVTSLGTAQREAATGWVESLTCTFLAQLCNGKLAKGCRRCWPKPKTAMLPPKAPWPHKHRGADSGTDTLPGATSRACLRLVLAPSAELGAAPVAVVCHCENEPIRTKNEASLHSAWVHTSFPAEPRPGSAQERPQWCLFAAGKAAWSPFDFL